MLDKHTKAKYYVMAIAMAASVLLSACSSDEAGSAGTTAQAGAVDDNIGTIYNRSCISCHSGGNAAAPRAHDVAAWQPKLDKGMEVLLANVKNGFGSMPPMGMCYTCSDQQLQALIVYMGAAK